jgi:hypothetical protein
MHINDHRAAFLDRQPEWHPEALLQWAGEEPHHPDLLQHSEAGHTPFSKRGPHLGYQGLTILGPRGVGSGCSFVRPLVGVVLRVVRVLGLIVTVLNCLDDVAGAVPGASEVIEGEIGAEDEDSVTEEAIDKVSEVLAESGAEAADED